MPPDISMFDFGLTKPAGLPVDEPPPRPALVYTAWHIWRVLKYHRLDIAAGKKNYTVPPIFNAFKVTCLVSPVVVPLSDSEFRTDAKKDLRVVRLFQPFRRTKNGTVEYVKIPPPLKPREQAAILLYALLPGEEGEKCSCCMAYDGSGPFRLCIGSSERWTGGACLNCYYTGTGSKCDLRIKHEAARQRELEEKRVVRRRFVPGAEKTAAPADIETWLAQIEQEERRRLIKTSRVMRGT